MHRRTPWMAVATWLVPALARAQAAPAGRTPRAADSAMFGPPPPPEVPDIWARALVPESLRGTMLWGLALWQWVGLMLALVGGWLLATLAASTIVAALNRLAARTVTTWDDLLLKSARRPVRLLLAVLLFSLLTSQLALPTTAQSVVEHLVYTGLVIGVAWLLMGSINAGSIFYEGALADDTAGELRSRSLRTRLTVARSVGSALLLMTTAAILLMQFEVVRNVGVSMLASAGVAGVVLGFAAQKSLSGVIAGLQLSISQPVRIGDLVQYENELGTIEEINLTYVVLKIWDERRLVIPISKFIETPVQNWSRGSLQLLGTITIHADPMVPVPLVRAEFERLCKEHKLWDGRKGQLHVWDMTPETVVLRGLISVSRPDDLVDLRSDLREGLISYLRGLDGGAYLPRRRWVQLADQTSASAGPTAPPPTAEPPASALPSPPADEPVRSAGTP